MQEKCICDGLRAKLSHLGIFHGKIIASIRHIGGSVWPTSFWRYRVMSCRKQWVEKTGLKDSLLWTLTSHLAACLSIYFMFTCWIQLWYLFQKSSSPEKFRLYRKKHTSHTASHFCLKFSFTPCVANSTTWCETKYESSIILYFSLFSVF